MKLTFVVAPMWQSELDPYGITASTSKYTDTLQILRALGHRCGEASD